MTANDVRIGLAIDEQARAAIVEDHVAVIPLTPAHDVAGEESSALGLRDRKRFGGLARLGDIPLRVEPERRQVHSGSVLLPVDHSAAVLRGARMQRDTTGL